MTAAADAADRARLLAAVLTHVPFDGWSAAALRAGARDSGIDAATALRLFPDGPAGLIAAFSAEADRAILDTLAATDLAPLRMPERIALAVRARIEAIAPHREAARRAAAHLALPNASALGARLLYRTVEAMWTGAGDRAADFSWYTKRATLAAVYAATLLAWFDDRSEGNAATWAFLDRRLADVARLGRLGKSVEAILARAPGCLRATAPRRPGRRWAPPRSRAV
ncbi:MAG: COQ9 family protein [Alphaproteobacteria bacterium]|nr:COQ9 family protein [Alphaproteobacteria bacterium]